MPTYLNYYLAAIYRVESEWKYVVPNRETNWTKKLCLHIYRIFPRLHSNINSPFSLSSYTYSKVLWYDWTTRTICVDSVTWRSEFVRRQWQHTGESMPWIFRYSDNLHTFIFQVHRPALSAVYHLDARFWLPYNNKSKVVHQCELRMCVIMGKLWRIDAGEILHAVHWIPKQKTTIQDRSVRMSGQRTKSG